MTRSSHEDHSKIRPHHLERTAFVYVRQSSPYQVQHHLESKHRQYDLVTWAQQAGWPRERIVVVDDDQGVTATIAYSRGGFGRVATAVARSEAGIVIALEVARLARNSPDWHHLMYVCRWTDTLIADENAVYDLSVPSDRMVLGLRGQMSELEMDLSIHRMVEARWNKARRGEVMTIPPAGYEISDLGNFVRTSDQAVANAIALVFSKFDELGSARQVWVWFCEQGLKLPVRRIEPRSHPVLWTEPKYRTVCGTLLHPIYAGAYVFGRSQTVRQLDPEDSRTLRVRCVRRPRKQWPVLILDHHDAYISFDKYLENRERMSANQMMGKGAEASNNLDRGPARRGPALLQGLVRCGRCGRKMLVSYGGDRAGQKGRTMQYRCRGARTITGGEECQLLGGRRIDEIVVHTFLKATEPAGVEAAAQAEDLVRQENEAIERSWQLEVEKAAYEAKRAERQYNAAEPENRIVVRELERRWNERLSELETVRAKAEAAHRRHKPLSEAELARAKQLGDDLEAVWKAETTTNQDRKRLLRCVIDEVQLNTEPTQYQVRIVWKGGEVTERHVVRRRYGGCPTSEDTIELVRKLATEFDDAQIARILNKQGRRSGRDLPFTKASVYSLRARHKIPACPKKEVRDAREGPFTADEAGRELGVAMDTIHRWLREGVLAGEQMTPGAPWRIVLTEEVRKRLCAGDAPKGWVGLSEASRRLGLGKSHVAYLVKAGKLNAVRTTVGKRTCWRIDVTSATCSRQAQLFDQTVTPNSEEA
jgi:DNA invertase Pin-like site-specific DNA recombinase